MNEKKIKLEKDLYKVDGGRVYIESEELANAIQGGNLDLFIDEEYNAKYNNCIAICNKTADNLSVETSRECD